MELKFTTETVHSTNYSDIEAFLNAAYPQLNGDYSFAASEECSNDSAQTFHVEACELDEYDTEDIEEGNTQYRTGLFLDDACRRGLIPEGKYVVEVSW